MLYKGPLVVRRFIEEIVFSDESIEVCIIDPNPENTAAIRAYEKVGFEHFKSAQTSEGPVYLMKRPRAPRIEGEITCNTRLYVLVPGV